MRLILRARAEKHIVEAYVWYETQRESLGREFITSLDNTIQLISENPLLFQAKYKNIRCALLKRFPYGIFYFIDTQTNTIVLITILHLSRNPSLWQNA